MKTKSITSLVFGILLLCQIPQYGMSQISPAINGKPDDFKMLKERTLIVELKEEDPKKVEKLTKKGKTDELDKYRTGIKNYNQRIKNAVSKYWTFNKNVEYKLPSEIDAIDKKDKKDYVVLYYQELGDMGSPIYGKIGTPVTEMNISNLHVPVISYSRLENRSKDIPDNFMYLPPIIKSYQTTPVSEWGYMQCSFNFTIKQLQAHTEYIIKTKKKIYYEEYAEKMSQDGNCQKLKQENILIGSSHLKSLNDADIRKVYTGSFTIVEDSTVNTPFVNQEDGKAVLFIVPYGISKPRNQRSLADNAMDDLAYFRIVIDCKTGDILYMNKSPRDYLWYLYKASFEEMSKCN